MTTQPQSTIKKTIGDIIFRHDFFWAKIFDVALLVLIILSSVVIMLETVWSIREQYWTLLLTIEWFVVGLFTIEYFLRVYAARERKKYIWSRYGIIDFLAVFPAYLSLVFPPLYYFALFRTFRFFRIFRILKLFSFLHEEIVLIKSVRRSLPKIVIFLSFILILSVIFASLMYIIEWPQNWFTDIPTSLYRTIVTITTVGYGDITPLTPIGKILASIIMLCGYGIIAVPTGIVVAAYAKESDKKDDQ